MPVRHPVLHRKTKTVIALLLTFTAGMVDIVAYICLYHVFVAHMTGTTVHLGNQLVLAKWTGFAQSAIVLLSFVGGSVGGRTIIEIGSRRRMRTIATITLLMEALLILTFAWIIPPQAQIASRLEIGVLLALLACAMGLQTATLTRIGPLTIHTTFVTGMLNQLAKSASQWMFWIHDNWRNQSTAREAVRGSSTHPSFLNVQLMTGIWCCYMIGSVIGTWMQSRWSAGCLYLPASILIFSAMVDQIKPLSLEEEADERS